MPHTLRSRPVRVGILGAGNISRTHALAARDIPGVAIAACWGRDPGKTSRLAEEFGAVACTTLDELVHHPSLDIVIIGTPSGLHADHAEHAARHGVHVLVEKPLDVTSTRADALIACCDEAGVKLGVVFQDRTASDLVWLRHAILTGALGNVFLASARVKWYRPPEYYAASAWRGTPALDGGGALINQGIHTVDLLLWLLGDVRRVSAATRTAVHHIAVEDTAVACLEFMSGALGTLEATTAAYPGFARRIEISGSAGTAVIEGDRVVSVDVRGGGPPDRPDTEANTNASPSSPVVSDVRGHRRVIENFLQAIESGGRPLCDGRDGRRSVALVEAIYEAARTAQSVTLTGDGTH